MKYFAFCTIPFLQTAIATVEWTLQSIPDQEQFCKSNRKVEFTYKHSKAKTMNYKGRVKDFKKSVFGNKCCIEVNGGAPDCFSFSKISDMKGDLDIWEFRKLDKTAKEERICKQGRRVDFNYKPYPYPSSLNYVVKGEVVKFLPSFLGNSCAIKVDSINSIVKSKSIPLETPKGPVTYKFSKMSGLAGDFSAQEFCESNRKGKTRDTSEMFQVHLKGNSCLVKYASGTLEILLASLPNYTEYLHTDVPGEDVSSVIGWNLSQNLRSEVDIAPALTTLGLKQGADGTAIKAASRTLALEWHTDKAANFSERELHIMKEEMQKINSAKEKLLSPQTTVYKPEDFTTSDEDKKRITEICSKEGDEVFIQFNKGAKLGVFAKTFNFENGYCVTDKGNFRVDELHNVEKLRVITPEVAAAETDVSALNAID